PIWNQEDDLALHEMEIGQPDAMRDRRRGGERQHGADGNQHGDGDQQPAIDGPPPAAEDGGIGAREGDHAAAPVTAPRRATSSMKASPRCSKLLYWSEEAQAGESSTTAPSIPSRRAAASASSSATSSVPQSRCGTTL